jgi:hypothetical protein
MNQVASGNTYGEQIYQWLGKRIDKLFCVQFEKWYLEVAFELFVGRLLEFFVKLGGRALSKTVCNRYCTMIYS